MDIGIDLGTNSVLVYEAGKGIILMEPSVVAIDTRSGKVLAVGEEAYHMLGRTPDRIRALRPLKDGVISDFHVTEEMLRYFLKKTTGNSLVKPRVSICVPSGITDVESRACVNSAVNAGARQVYLIEEPVAAAIGAGIDVERPDGQCIVDIGGGTTDIAVLSLNGIVCKTSIKAAGDTFDDMIIKYFREERSLLIGERMAEAIKIEIGSIWFDEADNPQTEAKGRDLRTGLPVRVPVCRKEILTPLLKPANQILSALQSVLEKTPPELSGDLLVNGVTMTGGGALLRGLDQYLSVNCKLPVHIAKDPIQCVAIGTGRSFEYLGQLEDGFVTPSIHEH